MFYSNGRKGVSLAAESPLIAAIVLKALRSKEPEPQLLLEAYQFIPIYCDVLGPMICFSDEDMVHLVSHLSSQVAQVDKTTIVLQQSTVSKKGKKRNRADLNVDSSNEPVVDPDQHVAALRALISLLVTDPRSVTESCFKLIVNCVVREVLSLNTLRHALSDKCVYSHPDNRKVLYELLELVAKYPPFPEHRPLHIALHVFAEAARWDTRDVDFHIPAACRNALLTLQLIVEPVIAPYVHVPGLCGEELGPDHESGIKASGKGEGQVDQPVHEPADDESPNRPQESGVSHASLVPTITMDDHMDDNDASSSPVIQKSAPEVTPSLSGEVSTVTQNASTQWTRKMSHDAVDHKIGDTSLPCGPNRQTPDPRVPAASKSTIVADVRNDTDMITISDDSSDEQTEITSQTPNPSVPLSTSLPADVLRISSEVTSQATVASKEQPLQTVHVDAGPSRTHVTVPVPGLMDESIEDILAAGDFGD